ncbi:unnamed protein product [Paramecium sonneborni]|uniref:PSI domain-containing protein n=1 Tax=Paramecium sonneborni TaxID=65129 RepID=A0A8S1P150_9CILI|nr:unnamed protein product [Paramecium sonneborni]
MKIMMLILLMLLIAKGDDSYQKCLCPELKLENDCKMKQECQWNKQSCENKNFETTERVVDISIKYCDQFVNNFDCTTAQECAWVDQRCTNFTGCTAYNKTNDYDCQSLSKNCITDGTHCVEIGECSTYKKQVSCQQNKNNLYCFWNTENKQCSDPYLCEQLPKQLNSDNQCRKQILKCTTNTGGGCTESGDNCSDQKLEIQCFWNKSKTMECVWDKSICKDKICINAPETLVTDDDCKQFIKDGTCTTKINGGCTIRSTCEAAKIQAACIKDNQNNECYWDGNSCKIKICINAPTSIKTNQECEQFFKGCITKANGGCVQNGECSAADSEVACIKNINNINCIWDNICKEKTCINSPINNNTHELCSQYLSTCTVKQGGGCQERSCDNAPTILTTNNACETYLLGQKCITKVGGGCIENTTCDAIKLEIACQQDAKEQICFWDSASSLCKDKICKNANIREDTSLNRITIKNRNTAFDQCQTFSKKCIQNQKNNGCLDDICENKFQMSDCTQDMNGKSCKWNGNCYKKQCSLAGNTLTTHSDCQKYLSSCTLSNSGQGCILLPRVCQVITLKEACVMKYDRSPCGWNGSKCIDKACSTASNKFTTTQECQKYLPECVANNPIILNGSKIVQGCQDLPFNCTDRKSQDNCEILRVEYKECLWNSVTFQCILKTCQTANLLGTTGALSIQNINLTSCQNYMTNKICIVNNTLDGCMEKPITCSQLQQLQNCQPKSTINGDCYWNGTSCVDKICSNIKLFTHYDCQNELNQCTVNVETTSCQSLSSTCQAYTTDENCKITINNIKCYWTGAYCRNATCADVPDTDSYDTDEECQNYLEFCTVAERVEGKGCVSKLSDCQNYMSEAQCHKTISNLTQDDDCVWTGDKCFQLSYIIKTPCSSFKGTQQKCQQIKIGCTNLSNAAPTANCILDCNKKMGINLQLKDCQSLDPNCSVRKDGSSCIPIQSSCIEYGQNSENCYKSTFNYCVMNNENPSSCQSIQKASECEFVKRQTGLKHNDCQAYNKLCTSLKDGSGCQEYQTNCSFYQDDIQHCTISQNGRCFFDGKNCVRFSICQNIIDTGLTNVICASYNPDCTTNTFGTACQEILSTCNQYQTYASCTFSKAAPTANRCVWNSLTSPAKCINVTNVSQECSLIMGINLNHATCEAYNSGCVANALETVCQEKKSACNLYKTQEACSKSTVGKCFWKNIVNSQQCISISNVTTDCLLIIGKGLTDATCSEYNADCTANQSGTACQVQQSNCNLYTNQDSCSLSKALSPADKCVWNTQISPEKCITVTLVNQCQLIKFPGLDDNKCLAYNSGCVSDLFQTTCQEKKVKCSDYSVENSCTTSIDGKCYWNNSITPAVCIKITLIASQCQLVIGSSLNNNKCASYNPDCTINAFGTACQEMLSTCNQYQTYSTCTFSKAAPTANRCVWNSLTSPAKCINVTDVSQECSLIMGINLNQNTCSTYNPGCTSLKDGTACQELKSSCKEYKELNKCVAQKNGTPCIWFENSCNSLSATNCGGIKGLNLDHQICQEFNVACTLILDGTGCQNFKTKCEDYPATLTNCANTITQKCFFDKLTSSCISIINVEKDCVKIQGVSGSITYEICQSYNKGCSVNRNGSACVEEQIECFNYKNQVESCYRSKNTLCLIDSSNNCFNALSASTCEQIILGDGNYNSYNCNLFKNGCTVSEAKKCVLKECSNAVNIVFNHQNCNNWLNNCTVNKHYSGCVIMPEDCETQAPSECLYSQKGECIVINLRCVRKTCEAAPMDVTHDNDFECSSFLQTCTVNKRGSCQIRTQCAEYKNQKQCYFNQNGGKCFWNKTYQNCVDMLCLNIESTELYDTHEECNSVDSKLLCTVKVFNGVLLKGCQGRMECSQYSAEEQCYINQNLEECVWGKEAQQLSGKCLDKSCNTAPISLVTHNDCSFYFQTKNIYCTVNAATNLLNNSIILGGCIKTKNCYEYIHQEQCQINSTGNICVWQNNQCFDKSCATAPITQEYDSHDKCNNYLFNQCTVSFTGQGCIDIPISCEIMTQKQCLISRRGDPCFWTGKECVSRSCENAPDSIQTDEDCQNYFPGCAYSKNKCRTKVCEDYDYKTDDKCQAIDPTCTTNGIFCVLRETCLQALSRSGCVTSSQNELCEWLSGQQNQEYCTNRSCETAPKVLKTEGECDAYLQSCTTKKGGGCVSKSTCNAVSIDVACTYALDGTKCAWNNNLMICLEEDCQDFEGITHHQCKARRLGCTVGENGKCARIKYCSETTVVNACIEGLDGPCLWIKNSENSQGACFQYSSCQSINWDNDQQCKRISNKCTTNGEHCVAITSCSETKDQGCVTGFDGPCIRSNQILNQPLPSICKPFTKCSDALYTTHSECQKASKNCTTNGETECILLNSCSLYKSKAGCIINDKGSKKVNETIISTGFCTWNSTEEKCRDQICEDIKGQTHAACNSKLSTCTSNGNYCLSISECQAYKTKNACKIALSKNNFPCFWDVSNLNCQKKKCSNIENGNSTYVCQKELSFCTSNGTDCIEKANCTSYESKIACNSGGLDGICVFNQQNSSQQGSICSKMVNCQQANNDKLACLNAKYQCFWKENNDSISGECLQHTCATYQQYHKDCHSFEIMNSKQKIFCKMIDKICRKEEPENFQANECFKLTDYTYTWSTTNNKCLSCGKKENNPTNNSTNDTDIQQILTVPFISLLIILI